MDIWNKAKGGPTQAGSSDAWAKKPNPGNQTDTPAGAPAASASKRASTGGSSGGQTRDGYWAAKEQRDLEKDRIYREEDLPAIRRSTAYNVASDVLAAAVTADALSFGSAAKGKRLDMMLEMLDLVAEHVYAKINGTELSDDAVEASEPAAEEDTDLG